MRKQIKGIADRIGMAVAPTMWKEFNELRFWKIKSKSEKEFDNSTLKNIIHLISAWIIIFIRTKLFWILAVDPEAAWNGPIWQVEELDWILLQTNI